MSKQCQSCGMPLNKDPMGGGLERDGSHSAIYCSLCYHDGSFRHPDFSASDMQKFCVEQLNRKGMPVFVAWLLTRGIPKLGRWRGATPK